MTKRALISALKAFVVGGLGAVAVLLSAGQSINWRVLVGAGIAGGLKLAWKYLDLVVGDAEAVMTDIDNERR